MARPAPARARLRAPWRGALRYGHVDTGAMYRAVAWKAVHDGLPLDDEARIAALARRARVSSSGTAASSSTATT